MAHNDPDEHGAAMKTFLNDWTPLRTEDRVKAYEDGPGVLFIDGDKFASRATAQVDASLPSDDATTVTVSLESTRSAQTVVIKRGEEVVHQFNAEDEVGAEVTVPRVDDPEAYTVSVQHADTDGWRETATVGVTRNPDKPLPDGRYYGGVVKHGGDMEETFGREVVSKYRHNAVKSWTNARYIVVADATRRSAVPDDVLLNPTEHEYDMWFNAFYTDYRDIGWSVLDDVLWGDWYPQNIPYSVICVS